MKERKRRVKIFYTLKKLRQLQRIVSPTRAGNDEIMNLDLLFQITSNQIFLLQQKVNVLKTLSNFFGGM